MKCGHGVTGSVLRCVSETLKLSVDFLLSRGSCGGDNARRTRARRSLHRCRISAVAFHSREGLLRARRLAGRAALSARVGLDDPWRRRKRDAELLRCRRRDDFRGDGER